MTQRQQGAGPPARRRKIAALILSGVFPGLGQFYNREPLKAAAFLVVGIVLSWYLGRALPPDPEGLARPGTAGVVLLCVLLAIWLWSIIDAWHASNCQELWIEGDQAAAFLPRFVWGSLCTPSSKCTPARTSGTSSAASTLRQ